MCTSEVDGVEIDSTDDFQEGDEVLVEFESLCVIVIILVILL